MSTRVRARHSPVSPTRTQWTGKNKIAAAVVLIAFGIAHVIGAWLLHRSLPVHPDEGIRDMQYRD